MKKIHYYWSNFWYKITYSNVNLLLFLIASMFLLLIVIVCINSVNAYIRNTDIVKVGQSYYTDDSGYKDIPIEVVPNYVGLGVNADLYIHLPSGSKDIIINRSEKTNCFFTVQYKKEVITLLKWDKCLYIKGILVYPDKINVKLSNQ